MICKSWEMVFDKKNWVDLYRTIIAPPPKDKCAQIILHNCFLGQRGILLSSSIIVMVEGLEPFLAHIHGGKLLNQWFCYPVVPHSIYKYFWSPSNRVIKSRGGPNSEYGPNTEYRIIRFLKILPIPNTELFGFWKWANIQ